MDYLLIFILKLDGKLSPYLLDGPKLIGMTITFPMKVYKKSEGTHQKFEYFADFLVDPVHFLCRALYQIGGINNFSSKKKKKKIFGGLSYER